MDDKIITLKDILALVSKESHCPILIRDEDRACICDVPNIPDSWKHSLSWTDEEIDEFLTPYLDRRVKELYGTYDGQYVILYGKRLPDEDGEH